MEKRAAVILLFLAAFLAGGILAQIRERLAHAAETENWGLSFQQEGQRPVANATIEELAAYDAWYAQDTENKVIYLTFDCGYENGNTGKILEALNKHNAPATFFAVGNFLRDNPELIKQIVSEGHTIGNHTMHHPDMSKISRPEFISERNERGGDAVPGDHRTGNDEILPPAAGKIQHREPEDGAAAWISDVFLESRLCGLVSGSASRRRRKHFPNCFRASIRGRLCYCITRQRRMETFWMSCLRSGRNRGIHFIVWQN